jgi:hypothetical protein
MMAKKPADRYQSMDEVAEALRNWITDYGQGSQSGTSLGGSSLSGRLGGGTPPLSRRLTQAAPLAPKRDSSVLPRAVAEAPTASNPSLRDTIADSQSRTPAIARRSSESVSDLKLPATKGLRKAKPLEAKTAGESGPLTGGVAASQGMRRSGEVKAMPRRKKNEPSKWVWIGIGAGLLVGIALLVVLILMQR